MPKPKTPQPPPLYWPDSMCDFPRGSFRITPQLTDPDDTFTGLLVCASLASKAWREAMQEGPQAVNKLGYFDFHLAVWDLAHHSFVDTRKSALFTPALHSSGTWSATTISCSAL